MPDAPRSEIGGMDLILATGTLRNVSFPQRVSAASNAGFRNIGLSMLQYRQLRDEGWSDSALRHVLDDHGVRLAECEAIFGFGRSGHPEHPLFTHMVYADPETEAAAFAMAEAFGARHVQVVAALEGEVNDDTVQGFAALCDRAADHGLLVALEFIPATIVPDAAVATRLVTEAGRANGGLCVDSWHFYRGAADEAQLRAIPPERVIVIQLDDGPAQPRDPEYFSDTIHFRNMPGEGEFDLVQFLRLLRDTGAEAPVSVEILSDALDSWKPDAVTKHAAYATARVIAAAQADSGD